MRGEAYPPTLGDGPHYEGRSARDSRYDWMYDWIGYDYSLGRASEVNCNYSKPSVGHNMVHNNGLLGSKRALLVAGPVQLAYGIDRPGSSLFPVVEITVRGESASSGWLSEWGR